MTRIPRLPLHPPSACPPTKADARLTIYATNPDESLCASIAWNLWTEGRLATDLLAGALPGIEHSVYWTPPFYYLVLAGWQGLWGPSLLAVRSLSLVLALVVVGLLWQRRRIAGPAVWTASVLVLFDPLFQRAASMARMDMLAIALTVTALVIIERGRQQRHFVLAAVVATAAMLTHPLGAAAVAAVGFVALGSGRRAVLAAVIGGAPLLLGWAAYIAADFDTFVAQMQLQLAVKADNARSPLDNLYRLAIFYGRFAPVGVAAVAGGLAGLIVGRRRLLPWLIGAGSLLPVLLFSGELVYPAYLAPFTAVGLAELLSRFTWGRRAVGGVVAVACVLLASNPPPLAGIDPDYDAWCDYVSGRLKPNSRTLLAIVPDPWFGLRHRQDLELRLIPPVAIGQPKLHAYVQQASDVVTGGFNPPGIRGIVDHWDELATSGQQLWILHRGALYNYEDVREDVRIRR